MPYEGERPWERRGDKPGCAFTPLVAAGGLLTLAVLAW